MSESSTSTQIENAAFDQLSELFRGFCKQYKITVFTTAADKHGSIVWEGGATFEALTRYLTLALTPMSWFSGGINMPLGPVAPYAYVITYDPGQPDLPPFLPPPFPLPTTPSQPDSTHYHAGVSITVDNEIAYTNQLHEEWQYNSPADILNDVETGHVERALTHAWEWARILTVQNLTKPYRIRRSAQG